jgi:hypothetical protein
MAESGVKHQKSNQIKSISGVKHQKSIQLNKVLKTINL